MDSSLHGDKILQNKLGKRAVSTLFTLIQCLGKFEFPHTEYSRCIKFENFQKGNELAANIILVYRACLKNGSLLNFGFKSVLTYIVFSKF